MARKENTVQFYLETPEVVDIELRDLLHAEQTVNKNTQNLPEEFCANLTVDKPDVDKPLLHGPEGSETATSDVEEPVSTKRKTSLFLHLHPNDPGAGSSKSSPRRGSSPRRESFGNVTPSPRSPRRSSQWERIKEMVSFHRLDRSSFDSNAEAQHSSWHAIKDLVLENLHDDELSSENNQSKPAHKRRKSSGAPWHRVSEVVRLHSLHEHLHECQPA